MDKKYILIIGLIVILGFGYWFLRAKKPSVSTVPTAAQQLESAPVPAPAQQSLTLGEALKLYAGKNMQFDANCTATPFNMVFKKGEKMMFVNGANIARPITVNGTRYDVKAHGFFITTITTKYPLPHDIFVDCGTGKNNAKITIE